MNISTPSEASTTKLSPNSEGHLSHESNNTTGQPQQSNRTLRKTPGFRMRKLRHNQEFKQNYFEHRMSFRREEEEKPNLMEPQDVKARSHQEEASNLINCMSQDNTCVNNSRNERLDQQVVVSTTSIGTTNNQIKRVETHQVGVTSQHLNTNSSNIDMWDIVLPLKPVSYEEVYREWSDLCNSKLHKL